MIRTKTWLLTNYLGIILTLFVAGVGLFFAQILDYSSVLVTLLIGICFNPLIDRPNIAKHINPGLDFSLALPLQIGTGLLGLKITEDLLKLMSPAIILLIIGGVLLTLGISVLVNRCLIKWSSLEAAMTGAGVAICGASALMAMSLVLKKGRLRQESLISLIMTVIGLSAIAMVLYPLIVKYLGFDDAMGGLIMGATIHQVSQVVGAGAVFGPEGMAVATMSKMLRVACLVPIMLIFISFYGKNEEAPSAKMNPLAYIPIFLHFFILLAIANVCGWVPDAIKPILSTISNVLILLAVAAIAVKTNLRSLLTVGWKPVVLMTIDSIFLFVWIVVGVKLLA
ncbi:MAG: putative sulfate exporter family transporter [Burkholderiaceae bacterium]|nr:putative sulfate exporter family transporter [Burkholderiaceae bacterium]